VGTGAATGYLGSWPFGWRARAKRPIVVIQDTHQRGASASTGK
jgi:hypothetical protein